LPEGVVVVRRYYLHTRSGVFYVQFKDQVRQKRLPAISTGKKDRDEALIVVAGWIKDGIPQKQAGKTGDFYKILGEFAALRAARKKKDARPVAALRLMPDAPASTRPWAPGEVPVRNSRGLLIFPVRVN
jgi:hypothetical protein